VCGIVGGASRVPLSDALPVERMRDTMRHRGPDDAGTCRSQDGRVVFGHRRLSIVDLSAAGHQPMSDPSGELTITFNGEIYNFRDLKPVLERCGHAFRTRSDTEVVLSAYRQWGEGMLSRLEGAFAFALYDARGQTVLLARDRAGEKPLYVSCAGGTLRFASELKALMADPSVERRVDPRALDFYLAYGYVPANLCMLAGVEKVPAGHVVTFDLRTGAARRREYWTLPPAAPDDGHVDERGLVDELDALLERSVRHQMLAADVPVGVLLSGGVDSSVITAMAARVGGPVNTFTISFPGHGAYDEASHARRIARHFRTHHVELPAEPASISMLSDLARQFDEPIADSSMIPTYLVARLVRERATVALGGDGGDELFGGYPHYGRFLRQIDLGRFLPGWVGRAVFGAAGALLPVGLRGRNFVLGVAAPPRSRLVHPNGYFDRRTRRRLLAGTAPSAHDGFAEAFKAALVESDLSPIDQATRLDFRTYLTDDILAKVDRASMLTSLEVRAPFLDRQVIEFAFGRVPARLRTTAHERKILLRRLARRVLPPDVDVDRKQGFSIPFADWFAGPWGDHVTSILRGRGAPFDRDTIESLIAGQRRGRSNGHRLFALAVFELWRREYRVAL
jgi:asparagine synthase (glutamine-hydrolysing)